MFSKQTQWPRGCWPNEAQRLLLQACLLDDRDARLLAWERWRRLVPFDFIDGSSLRMLPLLHERLRRLPTPVPDLERLAGIARFHWVQSQLLRRDTVELLRLFNAAGLDTMLLKGAALGATVYPMGLRPMTDIDIVVRRSQIEPALALLERHGWRPRFHSHARMKDVSHATHLTGKRNRDLDLHWSLFHDRFPTQQQLDSIWDASVPAEVGGQPTRVLCPADQLVHTCEHGVRHDETPLFRWLADAFQIIRGHGDAIDWERCARLARQHGLLLPVRQTLQYLHQVLHQKIPAAAWARVSAHRVPLANRVAHRVVSRRQPGVHPFWRSLPGNLLAYARWRTARRDIGLGQFLSLVNDLGMPPGKCLWHFSKLSAAAMCSHIHAKATSACRALAGRPARQICLASLPQEQLEGVYAPELVRWQAFRWTYPNATLRLSLAPGNYRVELRLLPVRDLKRTTLRILFNRSEVAGEKIGNGIVRFSISKQMFVDYQQQRLVLGTSRWQSGTDDPRQLGLPIVTIQFEPLPRALPPESSRSAQAA